MRAAKDMGRDGRKWIRWGERMVGGQATQTRENQNIVHFFKLNLWWPRKSKKKLGWLYKKNQIKDRASYLNHSFLNSPSFCKDGSLRTLRGMDFSKI